MICVVNEWIRFCFKWELYYTFRFPVKNTNTHQWALLTIYFNCLFRMEIEQCAHTTLLSNIRPTYCTKHKILLILITNLNEYRKIEGFHKITQQIRFFFNLYTKYNSSKNKDKKGSLCIVCHLTSLKERTR